MVGYVNEAGQFIKTAGKITIEDLPDCTEDHKGLMTTGQAKKLNSAYTINDVADRETVKNLFK